MGVMLWLSKATNGDSWFPKVFCLSFQLFHRLSVEVTLVHCDFDPALGKSNENEIWIISPALQSSCNLQVPSSVVQAGLDE
jgi:hypothetical protein